MSENPTDREGAKFHGMVSRLDPPPGQEPGGEQENAFRAVSRYLKGQGLKWFDLFRASAAIEAAGGLDKISTLQVENEALRQMVKDVTEENQRLAGEYKAIAGKDMPTKEQAGSLPRRILRLIAAIPAWLAENFSSLLGLHLAGYMIADLGRLNFGFMAALSASIWAGATIMWRPARSICRRISNSIDDPRSRHWALRGMIADSIREVAPPIICFVPAFIVIAAYPHHSNDALNKAFEIYTKEGMTLPINSGKIIDVRRTGDYTDQRLVAEFRVLKRVLSDKVALADGEYTREVCAEIEVRPLSKEQQEEYDKDKTVFLRNAYTKTVCRPVSVRKISHRPEVNYGPQ